MDLIGWLEDLAAAYRIEPSEKTVRRHLKSIENWRLSAEQRGELCNRALLRFARFPSIAELYEITRELNEEAEIKANTEWLARMHKEWQKQCASEGSAT